MDTRANEISGFHVSGFPAIEFHPKIFFSPLNSFQVIPKIEKRGVNMALGISGLGITGTLSDGKAASDTTMLQSEAKKFASMVQDMQNKRAMEIASPLSKSSSTSSVSSSQISKNHRLNGDYTMGFYDTYTSEKDKTSRPQGFAANASNSKGKTPVIDRTSDLYVQSMEMENYMVKMMLSSMRESVQHTSLSEGNDYARKMYDDMMYDNLAESMTKNAGFGLADQIYIELSGQR